ncbi:MAG TPA: thermonuclease family protein [Candidatus Saccharimonadales bacterium]|nr:thermonuclease family protein [Candidatus Saccharimonadales bacterium]
MDPRLRTNLFVVATGKLTTIGRQPDGDSIHFIPDNLKTLLALPHASRLRPAASDNSVQLRIDGIDAPETHFEGQAQPQGVAAREVFLRAAGFSQVVFDAGGTVTASTPVTVPATIFIGLLDPYGRPVSYLLAGPTGEFKDGAVTALTEDILARTVNTQMLTSGAAYVTVYSSTPPAHRDFLFAQAHTAASKKLGVWAADTSARFTLASHASLGPDGHQLLLPKLFRRATSYLDAVAKGYNGPLPGWLASTISDPLHSQDDYVIRAGGQAVRLHTLIHQQGDVITADLNLLQDVFIEQ